MNQDNKTQGQQDNRKQDNRDNKVSKEKTNSGTDLADDDIAVQPGQDTSTERTVSNSVLSIRSIQGKSYEYPMASSLSLNSARLRASCQWPSLQSQSCLVSPQILLGSSKRLYCQRKRRPVVAIAGRSYGHGLKHTASSSGERSYQNSVVTSTQIPFVESAGQRTDDPSSIIISTSG